MRQGRVPPRQCRGLVVVISQTNHRRHRLLQIRPTQVHRRIIHGIAPDNHQGLDLLRPKALRQIPKALLRLLGRFPPHNRLPQIPQRRVDRRHQDLHRHRLPRPNHQQTRPLMRQQILRHSLDPSPTPTHSSRRHALQQSHQLRTLPRRRHFPGQGHDHRPNFTRGNP